MDGYLIRMKYQTQELRSNYYKSRYKRREQIDMRQICISKYVILTGDETTHKKATANISWLDGFHLMQLIRAFPA